MDKFIKAVQRGSITEAYALVDNEDVISTLNMQIDVNVTVVNFIADIMARYKCTSVTSIGSGCGVLEWFISKTIGEQVRCVDFEDKCEKFVKPACEEVVVGGRELIPGTEIQPLKLAHIPNNNMLLFVWGTRADWKHYMMQYKGSCVMFISPYDFDENVTLDSIRAVWTNSSIQDLTGTIYDAIIVTR